MTTITTKELAGLFGTISELIDTNKDKITQMDADMGDGDLGITMTKGFHYLKDFFAINDESDIGKTFTEAGFMLMEKISSTMGFLLGSGFITAGKRLKGKKELSTCELLEFMEGMETGISSRGKCNPGDRTILDSIHEAVVNSQRSLQSDPAISINDLVSIANEGAKVGAEKTKNMMPKFGKALVHTNKAIGIIDQGAYVCSLFFEGLDKFVNEKGDEY